MLKSEVANMMAMKNTVSMIEKAKFTAATWTYRVPLGPINRPLVPPTVARFRF